MIVPTEIQVAMTSSPLPYSFAKVKAGNARGKLAITRPTSDTGECRPKAAMSAIARRGIPMTLRSI